MRCAIRQAPLGGALAGQPGAPGLPLILALAGLAMLLPILAGELPLGAALGLLALIPGALAARILLRHADEPQRLAPALRLTIVAAHLAAVTMAAGLLL